MIVKMLTVGTLGTNCFVVWCAGTEETMVIDPDFSIGDEGRKTVLHTIDANGLHVKYIIN